MLILPIREDKKISETDEQDKDKGGLYLLLFVLVILALLIAALVRIYY